MDSKHFFRKQEDKIDPLALRPRDAAAALGISPSTLERLKKTGKIPYVKINHVVLYRVEALRKWIKDHESAEHPPLPRKAEPKRPAVQTHQAPVPRTASTSRSMKRKKMVSAPGAIAVQGSATTVSGRSRSNVESAEGSSRFSQFLKSVGIAPSKLPPLTDGDLMRFAGVDFVQWHGWQYCGKALPDDALERLKHHLQRLASSPRPT